MHRRVVVTGLGAVTPVGNSADEAWENLKAGQSGITTITRFDVSELETKFAGEVQNFDPDALFGRKEARRMRPGHQDVGIEHQRRGQQDRDRRQGGREIAAVAPRQAVCQEQAQQRVQRRHIADCRDIGPGIAVGRKLRAKDVRDAHQQIGQYKAGRPEQRRANRGDVAVEAGSGDQRWIGGMIAQ